MGRERAAERAARRRPSAEEMECCEQQPGCEEDRYGYRDPPLVGPYINCPLAKNLLPPDLKTPHIQHPPFFAGGERGGNIMGGLKKTETERGGIDRYETPKDLARGPERQTSPCLSLVPGAPSSYY